MNKISQLLRLKKLVKLKFSLLVVNVKENYTTASRRVIEWDTVIAGQMGIILK
jgi:hypothetical protein